MDVFDELVIKPRGGYGGEGVAVLPARRAGAIASASARPCARRPSDYVAQRMVMLSTHPTVIDGRLAPRHVDLRPYVFLGEGGEVRTLPGGLTRVAVRRGLAGRQLVAERRRQGHVGAAVSRPLIGVTTSEVRLAEHSRPAARGRPAAARDGARDGLHALDRARRRHPGRAPAARPRHDRADARPARRRLPVGRPGHRPARLRRGGARPAARHHRARRSTATSSRSPSSPTRAGCRCSGSAAACRRSTSRAAARCTSTSPRADRHRQTEARPRHDPLRADRARLAARARDGRDRGRRQLLPPPGGRPARPGAARGRLGAGRPRRGSRERRRRALPAACSGTPSRSSTAPSTCALFRELVAEAEAWRAGREVRAA